MKIRSFDFDQLALDLDAYKYENVSVTRRYMSYQEIANDCNNTITKATIHRAFKGKTLDINTIIILCDWMGKDINNFIK